MNRPTYRTALITGASSGIGAEYARQLAAQGSDLVLAARRLERMESLAKELEAAHGIRVEALQADLETDSGIAAVENRLSELPELDLLVNNAGYGMRGGFSSDPVQKHLDLVQIQVVASTRLAHAALQGMTARDRGAIVSISSMAAFLPLRNVTYSAVKAYLVNFSEALQNELWDTSIKVQVVCAGYVVTEFHDSPEVGRPRGIPELFWLKASDVVKESLAALEKNRVVVIPSWQYRFVLAFARQPLTAGFVRRVARRMFGQRK
jgi:short-subunit dehydrogenase